MWDLLGSGIEPTFPALAVRLFTTEPPGESCLQDSWVQQYLPRICLCAILCFSRAPGVTVPPASLAGWEPCRQHLERGVSGLGVSWLLSSQAACVCAEGSTAQVAGLRSGVFWLGPVKRRAKKQSHLHTDQTRCWRTQPVNCDPGDRSGDVISSAVESGTAGPPARTGQRWWPHALSSECVTRSVFPVIPLVTPQAQAFIPQVMLSETCDGIIYHVTLDRFHAPIFLWLPFFLVIGANVVTHWVPTAV